MSKITAGRGIGLTIDSLIKSVGLGNTVITDVRPLGFDGGKKASVGKAIVGGMAFGPVGAIIGGIGIGKKKKNTITVQIVFSDGLNSIATVTENEYSSLVACIRH